MGRGERREEGGEKERREGEEGKKGEGEKEGGRMVFMSLLTRH